MNKENERSYLLTEILKTMLLQNIRASVKRLFTNKLYSLINIGGLSLSFAIAILIFLFVNNELSSDKHHKNVDKIYRVYNTETNDAYTAASFKDYIVNKHPEFECGSRYVKFYGAFQYSDNKSIIIENPAFVDSTFLDMFTINIIKKSKQKLLRTDQSILISEGIANKLFGDSDPLDQVIRFDNRIDYVIEGVYEDYPSNSSFPHDVIGNFPSIKLFWGYPDFNILEDDNQCAFGTYLMLKDNVSKESVENRLAKDLEERYEAPGFKLQKFGDIYFNNDIRGPGTNHGNMPITYLFLTIAIIIIVIAMINYVNLSTSVSTKRALSIGVQKTLGANRLSLIIQFMLETVLMCIISLIIGFIIAELFIPVFNNLIQNNLQVKTFYKYPFNIISLIVTISIALISGLYPAFYLTKLKPIQVLKGEFIKSKSMGLFKKGLMIFQFIITIILITGTIVLSQQLNYWRNMDLGFDKDNIVTFSLRAEVSKNSSAFVDQIKRIPKVKGVCFGSGMPGSIGSSFGTEIDDRTVRLNLLHVDADYFDLYGIKIIEGEGFSTDNPESNSDKFIINETAAKYLNWENPLEKMIDDSQCVGVVKDFIYESQRGLIGPLVIDFSEKEMFINIKISSKEIPETLNQIEDVWNNMTSNFPFIYRFIDDIFETHYNTEERLTKLLGYFAVFSIFIACLGLFGLISFMAEQRTKEIGVRKANGANIRNIILLFSKEFIQLIIISGIIAIPLSYYILSKWLQNFAYATKLSWWIFAVSIVIAIIISSLSVFYRAFKAASQNPVDALRYE